MRFVPILLTISLASLALAAFVEPAVEQALSSHSEAPVIVVFKEGKKDSVSISRSGNKNSYKAATQEFKIGRRYASLPFAAGNITQAALDSLSANPNVVGVYFDYPIRKLTQNTVRQINATSVHSFIKNNRNVTGENQTICILDTGIDYRHESLGACVRPVQQALVNANEAHSLDSTHPYANNLNQLFTITKPGFTRIAVHFVNVSTQADADFVYVEDPSGRILATYSGLKENFWTPSVGGDTIRLRLVTDAATTGYGFSIDLVNNGTTDQDTVWSCPKVIGGYDFVNSDFDPLDDENHGTHVSGIAAGNGSIRGAAPGARLLAVKVLNSSGEGTTSSLIAGIDWCTTNRAAHNTTMLSLSLGSDATFSSFCDGRPESIALQRASDAGLFVSVASGNTGSTGVSTPACASAGVAVGSVSASDVVSAFSNTWTNFMLLAPGEAVNSSLRNNNTGTFSGTSMAAPHVAGAVALLQNLAQLANNTLLSPAYLKTVLNSTGKRVTDPKVSTTFSRIDVLAALNKVLADVSPRNLTLVSFTNNSATAQNYSLINVTYVDDADAANCILEWHNGTVTNLTMSVASRSCWFNVTEQNEGDANFTIYVNDTFDNVGRAFFSVFFDFSPPTSVQVVSPANNSFVNTLSVPINFSFSEPNPAFCTLQMEGVNTTISAGLSSCIFSPSLTEGAHAYSVFVNDTLGHAAASNGSFTINVDVTPATALSFVSPTLVNASLTQDDWVFVNLTFTEINPNACVLEFNNVSVFNSTMTRSGMVCSLNRSIANQGNFNYTVWVNDSAGNKNLTSRFVSIDRTPPNVHNVLVRTAVNATTPFNVTVNATDAVSSFLNVSLFFGNGSINGYTQTAVKAGSLYNLSFTSLSLLEGNYTVNVTAQDNVSLAAQNNSVSLSVDLTAPTAPIFSVTANRSGFVLLNWSGESDAVGIASFSIFRNNSLFLTTSNRNLQDFSVEDNSTYSYVVRVFDLADNSNDSVAQAATVFDNVLPRVPASFNATNNADGSVELNWANVTTDALGVREKAVTFLVYRTADLSETNHLRMTLLATTSSLAYTDTSALSASTTYRYVVASRDAGGNLNSSLYANALNHNTVSDCTNSFGSFGSCQNGVQSRSRVCLGVVQAQTQSCGEVSTPSPSLVPLAASGGGSIGGSGGGGGGGDASSSTSGGSGGGGASKEVLVVYGVPEILPAEAGSLELPLTVSSFYTGFITHVNVTVKGIPEQWYNLTLPRFLSPVSNASVLLNLNIPKDASGNYTVDIEIIGVGTKSFGLIKTKRTFTLVLPPAATKGSLPLTKQKISEPVYLPSTTPLPPVAVVPAQSSEIIFYAAALLGFFVALALWIFRSKLSSPKTKQFSPGLKATDKEMKDKPRSPSSGGDSTAVFKDRDLKGQLGLVELLDSPLKLKKKRRRKKKCQFT